MWQVSAIDQPHLEMRKWKMTGALETREGKAKPPTWDSRLRASVGAGKLHSGALAGSV